MIWNEKYECMPRKELEELQLSRLKAIIHKVYDRVPFYRESFEKAGFKPSDLKSLDDLKRIPFISKKDLRENYPFKLFAEPMSNIVRIHSSSGTTGKPVVAGYTKNDIDTWAELMARSLMCAGAGPNDIIQNAYGYGLFTGGLGIHYGGERMGATVIPASGGNTKRQVMMLEDFGTTVLTCTPSYALYIGEVAKEMGIDIRKLPLRIGVFGAEPWSDNMRKELEAKLNIDAMDIYGLTEVIGPGVSMECEQKDGLHIFEDHFIAEIIDPETGEQLPYGETGELVFTSLTKEAFPVIRFRTRDITSLNPEPCKCGRTIARMRRVSGRTDDMLIIRGVNVFPSQIESVLMEIEETEPHYEIVVERKGMLDELEVRVEVNERLFSDEVRKLEAVQRKLQNEIESVLGISVKVTLVEPKTIERSEGKAKRVKDLRPKE
ncbi:TPA: phenylacetate--CoA ligase [Candidatus Poribacteria bacterium]|nr:phenylacetate--CoA ligase [Candidatus Poribacteria bacterium]